MTAPVNEKVPGVERHIEVLERMVDEQATLGLHDDEVAALQFSIRALRQGSREAIAKAAAFGGLNLGYGFLVTNDDLPAGQVYALVPKENLTPAASEEPT